MTPIVCATPVVCATLVVCLTPVRRCNSDRMPDSDRKGRLRSYARLRLEDATLVVCVTSVERHDFGCMRDSGCDILTQGLIGLIEYLYHQGIPSFLETQLQRTLGLNVLGSE
jgi:hypothetical protein